MSCLFRQESRRTDFDMQTQQPFSIPLTNLWITEMVWHLDQSNHRCIFYQVERVAFLVVVPF